MNYKIELTDKEIVLLGEALDAMPYGRVAKLVEGVQMQIFSQERAALAQAEADKAAAEEAWRVSERAIIVERARLAEELSAKPAKPPGVRRRRKGD